MKYLGIDYGKKYIGIAISDEGGGFAFPSAVVETSIAITTIKDLCEKEKAEIIVIGESVASNGQHNEIFADTLKFKEKLFEQVNIPIFFEKEHFSSVEAHRYQESSGRKDDSAAAIILQRFLDKNKMKK